MNIQYMNTPLRLTDSDEISNNIYRQSSIPFFGPKMQLQNAFQDVTLKSPRLSNQELEFRAFAELSVHGYTRLHQYR